MQGMTGMRKARQIAWGSARKAGRRSLLGWNANLELWGLDAWRSLHTDQGRAKVGSHAVIPQLCKEEAHLPPASKAFPYFLCHLSPQDAKEDVDKLRWAAKQRRAEAFVAEGSEQSQSRLSALHVDRILEQGPPSRNSGVKTNHPDLQHFQDRYDSMLKDPKAFGHQVQLLQKSIQLAQQSHDSQLWMRQLRPLQNRLREPGSRACLEVKPVVYAAFCTYSPVYVHIAASSQMGAAAHFLNTYLDHQGLMKGRLESTPARVSGGAAKDEFWLAHSSLNNICIYPLEALSPQLRLFRLSAPLRVAAWGQVLSKALAVHN